MITLFIFKSSSRGMQYGIGTYINELTGSLQKNTELMIYLVSYKNSSVKEFTVSEINRQFFQDRYSLAGLLVQPGKRAR